LYSTVGSAVFRVSATGEAQPLVDLPTNFGAMTREAGGTLLVTGYAPGAFTASLARLDPATGALTPLLATAHAGSWGLGIAILPDGDVAISAYDAIERLDLDTGARTILFERRFFAESFTTLAVVPVPEPATALLVALGLGALARVQPRRFAARANAQRIGAWTATGKRRLAQSTRTASSPIRTRMRSAFTARTTFAASFSGAIPKRMTSASSRAVSSASPP
jgi:hypothetical protein